MDDPFTRRVKGDLDGADHLLEGGAIEGVERYYGAEKLDDAG